MKKLNANDKPCANSAHKSAADEKKSEHNEEEPVKSEERTSNVNYNKNKEEEWRSIAKKGRYAKSTECKVTEKRRNNQHEALQHDNDHNEGEEAMHHNKDYGNMAVMPPIVHYQEVKHVESSK